MPLINADDTACAAGNMIEQFFGNVDGRAKRSKVGGECAAQIMQRPVGYIADFIKRHLRRGITGKGTGAPTRRKEISAFGLVFVEYGKGHVVHWKHVATAILGKSGGSCDGFGFKIHIFQTHCANFAPPCTCQKQKLDHGSKWWAIGFSG